VWKEGDTGQDTKKKRMNGAHPQASAKGRTCQDTEISDQAMDTHLMCSSRSRLGMYHHLSIGDRRGRGKSEHGKKITEQRILTCTHRFQRKRLVGTQKEDGRTTQVKRKRKEWVSWLGGYCSRSRSGAAMKKKSPCGVTCKLNFPWRQTRYAPSHVPLPLAEVTTCPSLVPVPTLVSAPCPVASFPCSGKSSLCCLHRVMLRLTCHSLLRCQQ
jgi:hypothetical protein